MEHGFTSKNLYLHALGLSLFSVVCLFVAGTILGRLIESIEKFSPSANKVEDFALSDYFFAYYHENLPTDHGIVIVNCAADSRLAIAKKLEQAATCKPAAIGIDQIFYNEYSSAGDWQLATTIDSLNKMDHNIVLAAEEYEEGKEPTGNLDFYQVLQKKNNAGALFRWGTVENASDGETMREFTPYFGENGNRDTAFDLVLYTMAYGQHALTEIQEHLREKVIVNYRRAEGNHVRFRHYDTIPSIKRDLAGKIVLFGTFDTTSLIDRHYSPLNGSLGRSTPDLNGIEYHAQVLSMLHDHAFLRRLPAELACILITMFFFSLWFIRIHHHKPVSYHYRLDFICLIFGVVIFYVGVALLETGGILLEPGHFITPIFACGFLLHLYDYFFDNLLVKFIQYVHNKLFHRERHDV